MAWTDQEKRLFSDLYKQVQQLKEDLTKCCNNTGCSCDCKVYPHIVKVEMDYFYIDENGNEVAKTPEEISIQDRFPTPACSAEVGILIFNDAWLICQYHDQDGWIIIDPNKK